MSNKARTRTSIADHSRAKAYYLSYHECRKSRYLFTISEEIRKEQRF